MANYTVNWDEFAVEARDVDVFTVCEIGLEDEFEGEVGEYGEEEIEDGCEYHGCRA